MLIVDETANAKPTMTAAAASPAVTPGRYGDDISTKPGKPTSDGTPTPTKAAGGITNYNCRIYGRRDTRRLPQGRGKGKEMYKQCKSEEICPADSW